MKNSDMNVLHADSGSTDFPWKWDLKDLEMIPKHGGTVFSCFSCGGGSSMGYKLAGFDVIGCCEIDPDMMKIYKRNNHPKLSYLMDIRDFAKLPDEELPEALALAEAEPPDELPQPTSAAPAPTIAVMAAPPATNDLLDT